MKRKRIVIKGEVQDVGYRLVLYEHAEALDISEFNARNIEDGVEVLVGGDGVSVDKLVDLIREESPERAEVKAIEVEDYEGAIKPIERFTQSFMLTQMGKFVNIGLEMLATEKGIKKDTGMMLEKQDLMLGKQDLMLGKQDEMIEKQDEMIEKQDTMIEKQDAMLEKQDTMIEKQDAMLEKQDETIREIRGLREDLKAYMEKRFDRIEREIMEIKVKIGMV
jgi:acylphosphatase